MSRGLRALVAALALAGVAHASGSVDWTPGEGAFLPGNLWVGADLNFGVEIPEEGPTSVEIDHLGILARWDPTSRLALFLDLRVDDILEIRGSDGVVTRDIALVVERLYGEVVVTPTLSLRLAGLLTPFGLWNPVHRAPLTWAVEEPAIADGLFPTTATGLTLLHRTTWEGWSFDTTLYGPTQDSLTTTLTAERGWIVGGRFAAGRAVGEAFGTLGMDVASYRHRHDDWTTATGLDLDVTFAGHDLMAEVAYYTPSGPGRTAHGAYVQDAIPLAPLGPFARDLYGVVRAEYFQPYTGPAGVGGLVGFFWRPRPYLVVRADYLFANRTLEELQPGFHGALAILF